MATQGEVKLTAVDVQLVTEAGRAAGQEPAKVEPAAVEPVQGENGAEGGEHGGLVQTASAMAVARKWVKTIRGSVAQSAPAKCHRTPRMIERLNSSTICRFRSPRS